MQLFYKLFGPKIQFEYDCFDRMVLNGYLSFMTREPNVIYFFRDICGIPKITKEVLAQRTSVYQAWVEGFARNHAIPMPWADDLPEREAPLAYALRCRERQGRTGVYFIIRSMEQGPTFRLLNPRFVTSDPNYMIMRKHRRRYMHYYFYIFDSVAGPMSIRIGSFLPFQATACLNGHEFMARRRRKQDVEYRKQDNAFLAVADATALQSAADGLNANVIRQRADYWGYWKNSFLKQYHKLSGFLRNEVVSNNRYDFGLKKGVDHIDAMRSHFKTLTARYADFQAQTLNGPGEFDLFRRLARLVMLGQNKMAGIKLEHERTQRILEVFLRQSHGQPAWNTRRLPEILCATFGQDPKTYRLSQLRYDLRKLRAHGLIERDRKRYVYRFTPAGQKAALLMTLFRKRIYGPMAAGTLFPRPDPDYIPNSKFERLYHKINRDIDKLLTLLAA